MRSNIFQNPVQPSFPVSRLVGDVWEDATGMMLIVDRDNGGWFRAPRNNEVFARTMRLASRLGLERVKLLGHANFPVLTVEEWG